MTGVDRIPLSPMKLEEISRGSLRYTLVEFKLSHLRIRGSGMPHFGLFKLSTTPNPLLSFAMRYARRFDWFQISLNFSLLCQDVLFSFEIWDTRNYYCVST